MFLEFRMGGNKLISVIKYSNLNIKQLILSLTMFSFFL